MKPPNIIYVLADDMGFGDLACNNPDSRVPTTNLDRLASQGMRMTDMHATAAVCTPSRYSVLTGRYAWRSRLETGIVWPWDAALIEPEQLTVAQFLGSHGYRCACIGKWHLGWDWTTHDGSRPNDTLPFGTYCDDERAAFEANIDCASPIGGGPTDRGFDTYFGVDVPNFTPYTWFEDDRVVEPPSVPKPDEVYGHAGQAVPGWDHAEMVPEFTRRAVQLIETTATDSNPAPLFLYFPLTSPHSPIVPNEQFKGQSGIGDYGDFVMEVDWIVGELMDALERTGQLTTRCSSSPATTAPKRPSPTTRGSTHGPSARVTSAWVTCGASSSMCGRAGTACRSSHPGLASFPPAPSATDSLLCRTCSPPVPTSSRHRCRREPARTVHRSSRCCEETIRLNAKRWCATTVTTATRCAKATGCSSMRPPAGSGPSLSG